MIIQGFRPLTLLDYPDHLAATVFVGGCNMRCPFCYNSSTVTDPKPNHTKEEVLQQLKQRKDKIEGVCITGGEPTLYKDLSSFIRNIKKLGLKVKLDTNGTNPKLLKKLIRQNLLDYVAMDIKSSLVSYYKACGWNQTIALTHTALIIQSVDILKNSPIDYEFRTTMVKDFISTRDIEDIGAWLKGAKRYYLQGFVDLGFNFVNGLEGYSQIEMRQFVTMLQKYIPNTFIRGGDNII